MFKTHTLDEYLAFECFLVELSQQAHYTIRMRRMHAMQTNAIDNPGCLSVCHVALLCNTAERIEVLFGVETLRDPASIV